MRANDRILEVNGNDARGAAHSVVVEWVIAGGSKLTLKVLSVNDVEAARLKRLEESLDESEGRKAKVWKSQFKCTCVCKESRVRVERERERETEAQRFLGRAYDESINGRIMHAYTHAHMSDVRIIPFIFHICDLSQGPIGTSVVSIAGHKDLTDSIGQSYTVHAFIILYLIAPIIYLLLLLTPGF